MRIASVNVAARGAISLKGREVATGIHKRPAEGRVAIGELGLANDFVADPRYHGGPERAVYSYAREHYAYWAPLLSVPLDDGAFGENLTIDGALEDAIGLGDTLRAGTALLQVTAPRWPCSKLAAKLGGGPKVLRAFEEAGRYGFYARVEKEGDVGAGDEVEIVSRDPARVTVAEVIALLRADAPSKADIDRALSIGALMRGLRKQLEERRSRHTTG